MFERYTEQARRTLFFARYEAFQLGSAFIETEHVLLGLFREEQSLTSSVFARARLSIDDVRREIEARTARHAPSSDSSQIPFSDETKSVFQYAAQEADRLLHNHIGSEHLLLGLFREERGRAAMILNEQGLRLGAVRDQIVTMLSASSVPQVVPPFGTLVTGSELRVSASRRERHNGPLVVSSPQSVSAEGCTLRQLIAWAYRADDRHVALPADLESQELYDARLDLPASRSWPAIDRLIQSGLNRHFGIAVALEIRPIDVFVLTRGDGPSPGRRRSQDDDVGGGAATMFTSFSTVAFDAFSDESPSPDSEWRDRLHSIGPVLLTATTVEDFARGLEEFVGHAVIDETGLTGTYDIELQGEMQGLDELRRALSEQLALVLTRSKRETPVLVVRRAAS